VKIEKRKAKNLLTPENQLVSNEQ